jgi:lactoylglutathione lyase
MIASRTRTLLHRQTLRTMVIKATTATATATANNASTAASARTFASKIILANQASSPLAMLFNNISHHGKCAAVMNSNKNNYRNGNLAKQIIMPTPQGCKNFRCMSTATTATTTKPYKILGLQQIAVGSTDMDAMRTLWMDLLGLGQIGTHTSEKENVIEDILRLGPDDFNNGQDGNSEYGQRVGIEVDLMTPIDENRSPRVHKPPLNHIGLWVDDLQKAVEWMQSKGGVRFAGGIRKGAAGYDVAFIHPKGNDEFPIGGCGVLIELVQAPEHVIRALKKK